MEPGDYVFVNLGDGWRGYVILSLGDRWAKLFHTADGETVSLPADRFLSLEPCNVGHVEPAKIAERIERNAADWQRYGRRFSMANAMKAAQMMRHRAAVAA